MKFNFSTLLGLVVPLRSGQSLCPAGVALTCPLLQPSGVASLGHWQVGWEWISLSPAPYGLQLLSSISSANTQK